MSSNFDWQNEEDDRRRQANWDEAPEPELVKQQRRPPWRLMAVVGILILAAGGIIWWRVSQRIEATLQAFRTDIVASHNLIQQAAAAGDEEIFRSLLSGRDPSWTVGEIELFRSELLFDRAPLGMLSVEGSLPAILSEPGQESSAEEVAADIVFSTDLSEAIVTIDQPFVQDTTQDTVLLTQTSVYRRGDSRWLLAPPLEEFWGEWMTSGEDKLTLIYPARDEAISQRLVTDLNEAIRRMCDSLENIRCSADLHLTVRFDTDPAAFASLASPLGALIRARESRDILELPAPTLVGQPVDDSAALYERGYQALLAGYSRHLVSAVIAQIVGWQCCDENEVFTMLLEYELSQLGLLQWPVRRDDYALVLDTRTRLGDLNELVQGLSMFPTTEEEREQNQMLLRLAVDFMVNGLEGAAPADLQRGLVRGVQSFNALLNNLIRTGDPAESYRFPGSYDRAWWLYAYSGSLRPSDSPEKPVEALYMACTATDGNQSFDVSRLMKFQPETKSWEEVHSRSGFIWMSSLANPEMLLVQEFDVFTERWQTNIWRDETLFSAFARDDLSYSMSFGETDPSGRKLVTYAFDPEQGNIKLHSVDLSECAESCAASSLPGLPVWSDTGEWAIYQPIDSTFIDEPSVIATVRGRVIWAAPDLEEFDLALGPGAVEDGTTSLIPVGSGRSPFWLDSQRFGMIQSTPGGRPGLNSRDEVIVVRSIEDPTTTVLVSLAELEQFLPPLTDVQDLSIAFVFRDPVAPQTLVITVLDNAEQRVFVFLYDLQTRTPELRLEAVSRTGHSLSFSPDGRYLLLTGETRGASPGDNYTGTSLGTTLLLHDISSNRTIPFLTRSPFFLASTTHDWSADGRWLAVSMDDNLIGLIAPEEEYFELLPHSYGACSAVAWLQE